MEMKHKKIIPFHFYHLFHCPKLSPKKKEGTCVIVGGSDEDETMMVMMMKR